MKKPENDIRESSEWSRSIGRGITKKHYRKKTSNEHAVCTDGVCEIHRDNHNPHSGPREAAMHIARDSPEIGVTFIAAMSLIPTMKYALPILNSVIKEKEG